ncbi:MAG: hypothetical protein A2Y82_02805 [Candidatus Buchananbacteria bacterium RBG_13_36_9]|uniref:DUF5673 domain-containing protein n=1 Tax=Candidatus Buchananbacteria bacterium RBG_13_36_9 TaxID=1797530 RepID=A0A1G1XP03_9BACT|nr:MAG: hypothetical protein A2Y82_02805 [Candidatus Buchananbacteria bacterium RBG_13_36_9]
MVEENITTEENFIREDDFGRVYFEWAVPEYLTHERSMGWYLVMLISAIALVIYCIFTANFLFALVIILVVFIVFLRSYYPPKDLNFQITEEGILLGNQLFTYDKIKNFYIIYKPPLVKKLFFTLKGFAPDLSIMLYDNNPLPIREKLLEYLQEDLEKEIETMDDIFEILLKL